jgi:hypothetical protein
MRGLPALGDLKDEMGRAAESGRPIHIALGTGRLGSGTTITSLAALQILEGLVDVAVAYDVPPIITVGDPTLVPLAQDVLHRAHRLKQIPHRYDPTQVRFVAPSPLAYAAGAAPVGAPEDISGSVVAGSFGSEVSLVADSASRRNTRLWGAADAVQAVGALYPATDRLAVGEELYAIGAEITGEQKYVTSLMAQDVLRLLLALAIVVASVLALVGG